MVYPRSFLKERSDIQERGQATLPYLEIIQIKVPFQRRVLLKRFPLDQSAPFSQRSSGEHPSIHAILNRDLSIDDHELHSYGEQLRLFVGRAI